MSQARCFPRRMLRQVDFGVSSGGAVPYLERIGEIPSLRSPVPTLSPADLRVNSIPLIAPSPPSQLQRPLLGEQPPDRGQTLEWPYPDLEREQEV